MKENNGLKRVLDALNRREPDLVPTMEIYIDPKVREAIFPGATYEEFIDYMDLDAIVITDVENDRYEIVDKVKGIIRDKWGVLKRTTDDLDSFPIESAIKSERDLDAFQSPDPNLQWRYEQLESAVNRFKGRRAVIAFLLDVFYVVNELRGMEDHFLDVIRNPPLIDRLNEIVLEYNLKYISNCIEVGADIIWIGGDFATNFGPMLSPEHMERFAIEPLRKQVELCQRLDIPTIKHTDGDINSIIGQMIDTGLNGIHPIDPVAGMDIGQMKSEFGKKICLVGNIDCAQLLCWGTEDDTSEAVKQCIKKAGYGGGFICTSSNTIHSNVNPKNYVAMVNAIKLFGKYPLSV
jgi:uroporphyrinogen decarboxylase